VNGADDFFRRLVNDPNQIRIAADIERPITARQPTLYRGRCRLRDQIDARDGQ
jgi:hypothetical protein